MTDREREQIQHAARAAGRSSRLAQGLPERITDARVVEQVAAIARAGVAEDRRAA